VIVSPVGTMVSGTLVSILGLRNMATDCWPAPITGD
jgi:hypothetical protein